MGKANKSFIHHREEFIGVRTSKGDLVGLVKRRCNDFNSDKFLSWIPHLQELRDRNNMINLSLSETKLISFFQMNYQPRTLSSWYNHDSSAAQSSTVSKKHEESLPFNEAGTKESYMPQKQFLWKHIDNILHFNCSSLSEFISKV